MGNVECANITLLNMYDERVNSVAEEVVFAHPMSGSSINGSHMLLHLYLSAAPPNPPLFS